jgi:2,3-bisphosphoglycerate-independent phosphoglycerate mutase
MTRYRADFPFPVAFPPREIRGTFPEVISAAGLRQERIAETEKYAHVTFFFNGGSEAMFPGEERILVPSPKVATYDLKPEMSAPEVTDRLVAAIDDDSFDFIVVNYANGDMVGHTGILEATIKAVETVDRCVGRLHEAVQRRSGCLVITADHGNAERMADSGSGQAHTAHTMNPVPLLLAGAPSDSATVEDGCLADIAPTILDLMGLPQPIEMTGETLLRRSGAAREAAAE